MQEMKNLQDVPWEQLVRIARVTGAGDDNIACLIELFDDVEERQKAIISIIVGVVTEMIEDSHRESATPEFISGFISGLDFASWKRNANQD